MIEPNSRARKEREEVKGQNFMDELWKNFNMEEYQGRRREMLTTINDISNLEHLILGYSFSFFPGSLAIFILLSSNNLLYFLLFLHWLP